MPGKHRRLPGSQTAQGEDQSVQVDPDPTHVGIDQDGDLGTRARHVGTS